MRVLKPKHSSNKIKHVYIAVDDLRIGGIQRLAMDEAYALVDIGIKTSIICFGPKRHGDSILELDRVSLGQLSDLGIDITFLDQGTKIARVIHLAQLIKSKDMCSVVCHSPSAAVMFRIGSLLAKRSLKINLWIHQLISLSAPVQKSKRLLYSLCATKIFFSSNQFKMQWELEPLDKALRKIFFIKTQNRYICRLGVHLPRVLNSTEAYSCANETNHFIFASRVTAWKGLDTFFFLSQFHEDVHPVLMSVNISNELLSKFEGKSNSNHVIQSRPPSFLRNLPNAIHIYPTNYGSNTVYPQSIGLNVIEFAALGVPSLVSKEIVTSYPELFDCGLVSSVDWNNHAEVEQKIKLMLAISPNMRLEKALWVRRYCSIGFHIEVLINSS